MPNIYIPAQHWIITIPIRTHKLRPSFHFISDLKMHSHLVLGILVLSPLTPMLASHFKTYTYLV